MLNKFNKNFLTTMGIDEGKSELIEFLVKNESLNQFEETEHFYYWFFKKENVLKDNFGFLQGNAGPFMFKKNNKEFDLNTFDGIAKLVIEVQEKKELSEIFNNNFNFGKIEFFLRYSKKFKKLEYFAYTHSIVDGKGKKKCFIRHKRHKFFSINEKNYVLIYLGGKMPRYISNKNAYFIRPIFNYNFCINSKVTSSEYEKFLLSVNRRLLSIHQKTKIYNDQNFEQIVADLKYIKNPLMLNTNNLDELLNKITKNKPVPKILIDKFPKSELVHLFSLIEYEEVDKIIKFLYENIEIYNMKEFLFNEEKKKMIFENTRYQKEKFHLHIHSLISDYLCCRFEIIKPNITEKNFINLPDSNFRYSIVHDYLRICAEQNIKLNMKMKSYNRLVQDHDRISFNISATNIPAIKPHKKYPQINSEGNFEIEKIVDKKRLIIESEIQKHCVKTYSHSINSGRCCIYSFLDKRDKKRYTLEIQKKYNESKELVFFLNQIRGKFNAAPSHEILFEVYGVLLRNKIYIDHQSAIKAHKFLFDSLKEQKNKNTIIDNPDDMLILPF
jgi:hypothetical protein